MAFARSSSGPAGLSINTGAANLFSGPSQPPAAGGGLFGAASATQPSTQTNNSLFGNNNTTAAAPSQPSLFGSSTANTNTNTTQQPQAGGGGLFGGASMATAAKPGGLFGSTTTGTTAGTSAPGGGLFGASTATSQPQQQAGGFFGQPAAASQPQQTGGLFGGATTTNTSQPQQTAGGLFGSTATLQKPATTSLFGGAPANTQPAMGSTGTSLFGQKPAQAGGGFGGGGGLFASLNTQNNPQQNAAPMLGSTMGPQVVPGVRIDLSNLRNTTRFNDLQEDLQKSIADIDQFIQNQISQKEQVDAFLPAHGEQLVNIPGDVRFVSRKYAAVDSALGADLQAIKQMRNQVKTDAEEAKLSFNAVNNLMLPSQYHLEPGYLGASTRQSEAGAGGDKNGDGSQSTSTDLVSYFSKATDEMDEQIRKLQKTVRDIETHLGGVEQNIHEQASRLQASGGGLGGGSQDDRVMELYAVLREFEEGIVQVATVVGGAREGVTELQMADLRGGRGLNGFY